MSPRKNSLVAAFVILAAVIVYFWKFPALPSTSVSTVAQSSAPYQHVSASQEKSTTASDSTATAGLASNHDPDDQRAAERQLLQRRFAYAQDWDRSSAPALAAFRSWTIRYEARGSAADADAHAQLIAEGVTLARARREIMLGLIEHNPQRAIASTVPFNVRQELPPQVLAELEQRVSGTGDFELTEAMPAAGTHKVESERRSVFLDGVSYSAFVYGRRRAQTTEENVSLHGITLDGKIALHESPVRLLEDGERPIGTAPVHCAVTGAALAPSSSGAGPGVLFEVCGKTRAVASIDLIAEVARRLQAAEDAPGPLSVPLLRNTDTLPPINEPLPPSAWTTGVKKLLVIRVDFSDSTGNPITPQQGSDLITNSVSPYFDEVSYGTASQTVTVTTNVYRMPKTAAAYATGNLTDQLYTDAVAAAGADYTTANFAVHIISFNSLSGISGSQFGFAGLASVGGSKNWNNGDYSFRVVAHELGHNYGLRHANLWKVNDGNPVSNSGSSIEYGDVYDVMGATGTTPDNRHHFNAWFKNRLGWIPDSSVTNVSTTGSYRVHRFDSKTVTLAQPLALQVFRDGTRAYWITFRKNFTTVPSLNNGAFVFWGAYGNRQSQLLDMTTPGSSTSDVALANGATFSDPTYGVTLNVTNIGGTAPNEFLDVSVTLSSPTQSFPAGWGYDTPTAVPPGLTGVTAVAAGVQHSLALKSDGTVVAWGDDTSGESTIPSGLANVVAIAAGNDVSGAVKSDGTVVMWGDPTGGITTVPVGLTGVTKIAIGDDHVLALKSNGTVVAWGGTNAGGQTTVPPGLTNAIDIAAGQNVSLAVKSDGTVTRWGNNYGSPPGGLSGVTKIASGAAHHLALKSDGTIAVWGNNSFGQTSPLPSGLTGITDIACGAFHSLAVKSDGTVVAWGSNDNEQINVPPGMPRVSSVSGGYWHSLAVVAGVATVSISTQPSDQSAAIGGTATFTVAATGTAPITYQWQRQPAAGGGFANISNGGAYSGATTASLQISSATAPMSGDQFKCVVTAAGQISATSNAATLTVGAAPTINTQPAAQSITAGGSVTFSVAATGSGPLSYQWRFNGVDIAGATASSYALPSGQSFHAGSYRVVVTSAGISATSNAATLTVNPAPASAARLLNLSTRALCLTGNDALIPGFVLSGSGTKKILSRAVGPTLGTPPFNVGGVLADPQMTLQGNGGVIASNDNWSSSANKSAILSAFSAVGAFDLPDPSLDAALLSDLSSGAYTVVTSGAANGTGVAIVELYDVDGLGPNMVNISNRGFVSTGGNIMMWDPLESTCRHASLSIL